MLALKKGKFIHVYTINVKKKRYIKNILTIYCIAKKNSEFGAVFGIRIPELIILMNPKLDLMKFNRDCS